MFSLQHAHFLFSLCNLDSTFKMYFPGVTGQLIYMQRCPQLNWGQLIHTQTHPQLNWSQLIHNVTFISKNTIWECDRTTFISFFESFDTSMITVCTSSWHLSHLSSHLRVWPHLTPIKHINWSRPGSQS